MAVAEQTAVQPTTGFALGQRLVAGGVGGLIGGVAFGVIMQTLGMIPMVAMLVGSESALVGWGIHLGISVALGLGYGLVVARPSWSLATGIGLGAGYGVIWWVLGALLLMPAKLGMPTLTWSTAAGQSLIGHVVFGVLLGATYTLLLRRPTFRS